jgi:hypothetical protein
MGSCRTERHGDARSGISNNAAASHSGGRDVVSLSPRSPGNFREIIT